jgi:hypothetical protein
VAHWKFATLPEADPVNERLLKLPHSVLVTLILPVKVVPVCVMLALILPLSPAYQLPDQFPVKSAHKAGDNWKQIIITGRRGITFDITLFFKGLQIN